MANFNKVILLGALTRDPEVRYSPNGKAIASFSIAINEKYKNGDGEVRENVHYIDIVVFGKQAENCGQYLNKGDAALIEGRLQQRRWDDKETGQKRSKVEVAAQSVTFMPKRQQQAGGGGHASSEPLPEPPVDEGDIPF